MDVTPIEPVRISAPTTRPLKDVIGGKSSRSGGESAQAKRKLGWGRASGCARGRLKGD